MFSCSIFLMALLSSQALTKNTRNVESVPRMFAKKVDPRTSSYLRLRQLIELRNNGSSYEELKAASIADSLPVSKFRRVVKQAGEPSVDNECETLRAREVVTSQTFAPEKRSQHSESQPTPINTTQYMYTPRVSTWGVYERPRNMTQAFGGGRTVNRYDTKKKLEQQSGNNPTQPVPTVATSQTETEHREEIIFSMARCRGLLHRGNVTGAADALRVVAQYVPLHTDLGGEFWLEYAMALEAAKVTEEAGSVYRRLQLISWSPRVQRLATQLLAGMEAYASVEQTLPPVQAGMDSENMRLVSQALEAGLYRQPWERMKVNEKKRKAFEPWLAVDVAAPSVAQDLPDKVCNLTDARAVLLVACASRRSSNTLLLTLAIGAFANSSAVERQTLQAGNTSPSSYTQQLNGSWELFASLQDASTSCKMYGTNAWRRTVETKLQTATDEVQMLGGIVSTQLKCKLLSREYPQQPAVADGLPAVQVLYWDRDLLVTREVRRSWWRPWAAQRCTHVWKRAKQWNSY